MRSEKFARYMNHLLMIIDYEDMDDDMKLFNINENIRNWVKDETWRNPSAENFTFVSKEDADHTACRVLE